MTAQWTIEQVFKKCFNRYCEDRVIVGKLSADSYASYKHRLVNHVVPRLGRLKLSDLDLIHVSDFVTTRLKEKDLRGHFPKISTINREVTALSVLVNAAIHSRLIGVNPLKGYEYPPENNRRERVLESEEIDRLLQECRSALAPPYLETMVLLALNTGLRKDGVLGLRWEHIDWKRNEIKRRVKAPRAKGFREVCIPMTSTLREALTAWKRANQFPRLAGLVFPSPVTGEQMRVSSNIGFGKATERAGIAPFLFHEIRHTFITHFIEAGNSLELAGEIVGHSTSYMTARYMHLRKSYKETAMKSFDLGGRV